MPEIENKQVDVQVVQHKLNDDVPPQPQERSQNTLLISASRSHQFYERAARELLASGHEEIKLSALGEAMVVAVKLCAVLEEKSAATVVKIETVQPLAREFNSRNRKGGSRSSPGILITMKKDESFRGTKITPGYISFSPSSVESPQFPATTTSTTVCILSRTDSSFSDTTSSTSAFLKSCGLDDNSLLTVHESLVDKMLKGSADNQKGNLLCSLENVSETHPDFSAACGRLCPGLKGTTGAVFLVVLSEPKRPFGNTYNYAVGTVVYPEEKDFSSSEDFLTAVESTGGNLMAALCDFNGMAKRVRNNIDMRRLATARIECPVDFSRSSGVRFLSGLNNGYHYGPAPRLNFVEGERRCLKEGWMELSGIEEKSLNINDGANPKAVPYASRVKTTLEDNKKE